MEKNNEGYLDLTPNQEEVQDFNTGFEMNLGNFDSSLEGIPSIELEIGLTNF